MLKKLICRTAIIVVAIATTTAQAATILVDYDDGISNGIHDVAVRNGGFESPTTGVDGEPFSNTDNWINLQGGQAEQARRTNIKDTGDFSTVNSASATKQFALDTDHTISLGDIFSLEFRARGASASNATSTITADLYYTDDDSIGGTATNIGTVTATNMTASFATYNDTFAAVGAADPAIGKTLFLKFEQSSGPGFTRTDSWYLTVVPEPSTLAFAAFGLVAVCCRRRR